jgi:hypothetical protein
MHTGIGAHADEETLEKYAMGSLPDAQLAVLEEHLLVCLGCQEQLQELDHFVAAMRRVAPRLQSRAENPGYRLWSSLFPFPLTPRLAFAGAVAVLVLVLLAGRPWQPGGSPQPALVLLSVERGAEAASGAAPANRPLQMQAGISEFPQHRQFGLELVDSTGNKIFAGEATVREGQAGLTTPRGLPAGAYFVRLYSSSHKLLREFAVTVR